MDITRRGAERDRGETTIISNLPFKTGSKNWWDNNVRWDRLSKKVVIRAPGVCHTDGRTHHDYTIELSLDDVAALIELLGHVGAASDAKSLRDHLGKNIRAIVKLLACATGVAPVPIKEQTSRPKKKTAAKKKVAAKRVLVKKKAANRSMR